MPDSPSNGTPGPERPIPVDITPEEHLMTEDTTPPSVARPLSPSDALRLEARELTRAAIVRIRWMFGIAGIAAAVIGLALLVWPGKSRTVAAVLLGVSNIVSAVVRLAVAVAAPDISAGWRILDVLFSVLFLMGGVFMVRNSAVAAGTLAIIVAFIVGIGWISEGILALIESARSASPGWAVAFGLLSIAAGVIVVAVPGWSAVTLVIFTGAAALVTGVAALARAFTFGRDVLRSAGGAVVEGEVING
jgi:uncharacterized membrane protein HdeD (DUF308 family)